MDSNLNTKKILFIGGGNMASAILAGLVKSGVPHSNIEVVDHNKTKLDNLSELYNISTYTDIKSVKTIAEVIILAVKPNVVKSACQEIKNIIDSNTLIISVAAGVTTASLKNWLNKTKNIIRSMPNTPATIGKGVTILYQNISDDSNSSQQYCDLSEKLFNAVGSVFWVNNEDEINTYMAISGCGPAYVFLFCESLFAAAQSLGINPNTAKQLITQTIIGSSEYYLQSDKTASELRREVTSPNGTTEQAVNTLDPISMQEIYTKALAAAVKRAKIIEQDLKD